MTQKERSQRIAKAAHEVRKVFQTPGTHWLDRTMEVAETCKRFAKKHEVKESLLWLILVGPYQAKRTPVDYYENI